MPPGRHLGEAGPAVQRKRGAAVGAHRERSARKPALREDPMQRGIEQGPAVAAALRLRRHGQVVDVAFGEGLGVQGRGGTRGRAPRPIRRRSRPCRLPWRETAPRPPARPASLRPMPRHSCRDRSAGSARGHRVGGWPGTRSRPARATARGARGRWAVCSSARRYHRRQRPGLTRRPAGRKPRPERAMMLSKEQRWICARAAACS